MGYYKTNRDFHEARWDEPIIMKLGNPGERGVLVPKADEKVTKATGTVETLLPENLIRKKAPKLPEMSQMQVLRHYMRLSQETIGTDFNIEKEETKSYNINGTSVCYITVKKEL